MNGWEEGAETEVTVIEDGTVVGALQVSAQGLYTVFEARLQGEGSGLSRLWLGGGEGASASLGLLEPGRGERRLRRRFSRLELQKLPPKPWIARVLPDGESPASGGEKRNTDCPVVTLPAKTDSPDPAPKPPEKAKQKTKNACSWIPRPDGSLYDPERSLLALPWAGGDAPAAARILRLAGREYWVFRA